MTYKFYDSDSLLKQAREISNVGLFLTRDYARCKGIGKGNIICDRRQSCLRYQEPEFCTENYSWFLPILIKDQSGCEEYIGDE